MSKDYREEYRNEAVGNYVVMGCGDGTVSEDYAIWLEKKLEAIEDLIENSASVMLTTCECCQTRILSTWDEGNWDGFCPACKPSCYLNSDHEWVHTHGCKWDKEKHVWIPGTDCPSRK
jgi:hypothetical protein